MPYSDFDEVKESVGVNNLINTPNILIFSYIQITNIYIIYLFIYFERVLFISQN